MRIVIDLQGAQGENAARGIGRYSISLAKAMAKHKGKHDIIIVLNGHFVESINLIHLIFKELIPRENIHVWHPPAYIKNAMSLTDNELLSVEQIYEHFVASLNPDALLITSLFEGFHDPCITSVKRSKLAIPTIVLVYDLIPLIFSDHYLSSANFKTFYEKKLEYLKQADLLFSISTASRQDAIKYLSIPGNKIVSISAAVDPVKEVNISVSEKITFQENFNIIKPYILYVGGIDPRKNIEGLLSAYAALPVVIRDQYQLVIVCQMNSDDRLRLNHYIDSLGMPEESCVLTGHLSESDLKLFYQLCKVFIFPSLYEGFGLPVLEAMSLGKAVIASNTSSLPEVIGNNEALFDINSQESIVSLLQRVLIDDGFRMSLEKHASAQSKIFSWEKSANMALSIIESYFIKSVSKAKRLERALPRSKLAYISPLPPLKSGVSTYSSNLIRFLSVYYDIDVIVDQDVVSDKWVNKHCKIRSAKWFYGHSHLYDRIIYHIGNSVYHKYMFGLLDKIPGIVVVHDFYISGLLNYVKCINDFPWHLYRSHGYVAIEKYYHINETHKVALEYPCNLQILQQARGIIVHSMFSKKLIDEWYGVNDSDMCKVIPMFQKESVNLLSRKEVREKLGFSQNDFIVCSFGMLGESKLNDSVLDAWLNSSLVKSENCYLIFVGDVNNSQYHHNLLNNISQLPINIRNNIKITGWVDADHYLYYLTITDIAVQLRKTSRGETSSAMIDCLKHGIPTIINNHGSNSEISDQAVFKLSDQFEMHELTGALENLWNDLPYRNSLSRSAHALFQSQHRLSCSGNLYLKAIEHFYSDARVDRYTLLSKIAEILPHDIPGSALMSYAKSIDRTFPVTFYQRQLLVDISGLIEDDDESYVQRIVRNVITEWLLQPPTHLRIEPVYATKDGGYRYARKFTLSLLACEDDQLEDEYIDYKSGDIFYIFNLNYQIPILNQNFYHTLRAHGVTVCFLVYDLLPLKMPHYYPENICSLYAKWLNIAIQQDKIICVSNAVKEELSDWLVQNAPNRLSYPDVIAVHLAASHPTLLTTHENNTIVDFLKATINAPIFTIVDTLEPRKGHLQALSAFEILWKKGLNVALIFVGKKGWMIDHFIRRLECHSEWNRRLFWIKNASDSELEKIYTASSCLIATSEGEGFYLPIIEAAKYQLPIIARNLPVFYEILQEHAVYFSGYTPEALARTLEKWMTLYLENASSIQKSNHSVCQTWSQTAAQMLFALLKPAEALQNEVVL